MKISFWKMCSVFALAFTIVCESFGESYPSKPIKLIVPSDAGSPPDIRSRWIAEKLRLALGQPIIIENRGGAAGRIGTAVGAKSAPDGYTLVLVHQGTLALSPHLHDRLGYDPFKDFSPVAPWTADAMVLAVHPGMNVHSVGELIRLAKDKPGKLNWGSGLIGSPPYMAGELFRRMARIDVAYVPHKNVRQAQTELVAGRLSYLLDGISMMLPDIKSGNLRALGVTSARRIGSLPDVPTLAEAGVPGCEYMPWIGVGAPAGTPREIVDLLNGEMAKVLGTREAQAWLANQGSEALIQSPTEFSAFIKADFERWGTIIRQSGMRIE